METDRTVLRTGRDAQVVKRVPLDVQHRSAVTADPSVQRTHTARLKRTHTAGDTHTPSEQGGVKGSKGRGLT